MPTASGSVWIREYHDRMPGFGEPLPNLREFFSRPADFAPGPEDILFLDTETTGLAGGTGTIPFLVGVSWWKNSIFTTRQYFLPEPGHEVAMLRELDSLADGFRVHGDDRGIRGRVQAWWPVALVHRPPSLSLPT